MSKGLLATICVAAGCVLLAANLAFAQTKAPLREDITQGRIERHAFHILVDTAEFAAFLKRQIDEVPSNQRLAKFKELASLFSQDPGSAGNGGDLAWSVYSEFVTPFAETLFALPLGVVSDPVSTQFGWHLIYVTEERPRAAQITAKAQFFGEVVAKLSNRWVLVAEGETSLVFGATEWGNLGDGRRSRWFLWAHIKPESGSSASAWKPWSSSRVLNIFDCRKRLMGRKQVMLYAGNAGDKELVASHSFKDHEVVMDEVAPDTIGEEMLRSTCSSK